MSQNGTNGNFSQQLPSLPRLSHGFSGIPQQQNQQSLPPSSQTASQHPSPLTHQPSGRPNQPPPPPQQTMQSSQQQHQQGYSHSMASVPQQTLPPMQTGSVPPQPFPDHRARLFPPGPQTQQMQQQVNPPSSSSVNGQQNDPNGNRPLNVRDALTYLDDVKEQFADEPDVYHRFLDIMKDFKTQVIDTPGVIEEVSTLFRGHPNLILGFNTFLPPGYRIEIKDSDASGAYSYTIKTPDTNLHLNNAGTLFAAPPASNTANPQMQSVPHPSNISAHQYSQAPLPYANHPNPLPPQQQGIPPPTRQPIEFNHAITYVNRIKNRFSNDPETYRQFLEILRTYHSEGRPIADVYAQIQILFKDATDLLEEFRQFLPDPSTPQNIPPRGFPYNQQQQMAPQPMQTQGQLPAKRNGPIQPIPTRAAAPPMGKFRRPIPNTQAYAKKARFDPSFRQNASEEFEFFEKVKRHLGNKTTYAEFLKVLNLFNQDIIDPKLLIEKVEPFLARAPDLFEWFKSYVRFDEKDERDIIPTEIPPRDLADAKRSGSSYRLLPHDYVQASCSGRDSLAGEVLNDRWVCHPTWASEDGGFVAHRKNQFEEALYRCEEERYEFDLCIEANKCVIQRLEPIAKKIAEMTPEEQKSFKLPDGLGDGMSRMIYKRVIKKIYDKDRGLEVIEALHEQPSVTVPIVLKRLKQKDEEWRRSQREWNKVWREIDSKNFYKSLDHQGINFKAIDKKSLTSKSLIVEIETLYRERHEKPDSSVPKHHLQFEISDKSVQKDIHRLMLAYLEKASQFSPEDIERVGEFLKKIIIAFHIMKKTDFESSKEVNVVDEMQIDTVQNPEENNSISFLANNSYYLFFRLYEIAYSRMMRIRSIASNLDSVRIGFSTKKAHKIPESLDLVQKRDIPQIEEINTDDIYQATIALMEKFFENDVEATMFEDQARFWYGTSAYVMYTADKLFHSLCKQLVHIVGDARCNKLFSLFQRYLGTDKTQQPLYRLKADELIDEEENIYRIDFDPLSHKLKIELLGEEAVAGDKMEITEVKWSDYIDLYVKGPLSVDPSKIYRVFLNRNMTMEMKEHAQQYPHRSVNNLECKICINTYKMFFVKHSEDYFQRMRPALSTQELKQLQEKRREKLHVWLKNKSNN